MARRKSLAFLDVGQGDCFVADTKSGAIIFDGGSSSEDQVGRYRILPYMKYLGYQKIQIAVISHMDIDHYSGIKELLKMGKIKYLGLPEIPKDETMKKIIGEETRNNYFLSFKRKADHYKRWKFESVASSKEQSDGKECGIVGNAGKNTWISGAVNGRCGKRRRRRTIIRRIGKSRYIKSSTSWVKKFHE